ncbi:hypothetical protein MLD38_009025 [Melastoma candidum]|uniref:Uncharacterized protein n=1 Tax=Melastoma candidum TaxID=119954 RepID=A0ACB9RWS0_9MYRT|nr:hypothetical protein MLD38_009025 [Melastoma candidum]
MWGGPVNDTLSSSEDARTRAITGTSSQDTFLDTVKEARRKYTSRRPLNARSLMLWVGNALNTELLDFPWSQFFINPTCEYTPGTEAKLRKCLEEVDFIRSSNQDLPRTTGCTMSCREGAS